MKSAYHAGIDLPNGIRLSVSITVPETVDYPDQDELSEIAQMIAVQGKGVMRRNKVSPWGDPPPAEPFTLRDDTDHYLVRQDDGGYTRLEVMARDLPPF